MTKERYCIKIEDKNTYELFDSIKDANNYLRVRGVIK